MRPTKWAHAPTDATARLRALRAAGDSVPALVEALGDPSEEIVRHALRRLAHAEPSPDVRERLRQGMVDAPPTLAEDYARALVACGDGEATARALLALRSPSYSTRLAAARSLAIFAHRKSAGALRVALHDPVVGVRRAALDALARLGPCSENAAACALLLHDDASMVRAAAVNAITHAGRGDSFSVLAPLASDPDDLVRREVARHAGRLPPEATASLLSDADARVRATAVRAAARTHASAIRSILLGDPDPAVRRAAAVAIGSHSHDADADSLVRALGDADSLVRVAALRALVTKTGERGAARLVRGELVAGSAERRRAALYAMSRLGAHLSPEHVTALVHDPDVRVRAALAHVLPTVVHDPQSAARHLLEDESPLVRGAAERHRRLRDGEDP